MTATPKGGDLVLRAMINQDQWEWLSPCYFPGGTYKPRLVKTLEFELFHMESLFFFFFFSRVRCFSFKSNRVKTHLMRSTEISWVIRLEFSGGIV